MNTCLSNLYLKICQINPRHIRLAFVFLALAGSFHFATGIPIHGDVGG